jgi:hypothetical protein
MVAFVFIFLGAQPVEVRHIVGDKATPPGDGVRTDYFGGGDGSGGSCRSRRDNKKESLRERAGRNEGDLPGY